MIFRTPLAILFCALLALFSACVAPTEQTTRTLGRPAPTEAHPPAVVESFELRRLPKVDPSSEVIRLVVHDEPEALPDPEELPLPSGEEVIPLGQEVYVAAGPLLLEEVAFSIQQSYPLLMAAIAQREVADGDQVSAWGEFDLQLKSHHIAMPLGFYENYRNAFSGTQPLFNGGYLYGGYKIGDGSFQPWFKERETSEGGEFSAGVGQPLLQGRAIDKRRAELFQADIARQAVEPAIQAQLVEFLRAGSLVYWQWVAAGRNLEAQQELLRIAEERVDQIEIRVEAEDIPRIARINNQQLIASREAKVIESRRKLQQSAIKLSMFLRDPVGNPVVPSPHRLPESFPDRRRPSAQQMEADIQSAIDASPLLAQLDLAAERETVKLQNAENMMLPKVDAFMLASKDVGGQASRKRDKLPFELEAGLYGELPLQRRAARGKMMAAQGKLAGISAKRQFTVNKIAAAVQDSISALIAAERRIERTEANLRLARQTLQAGLLQFDAGDIDLVTLNIYERAVTDARMLVIAAQADFFSALADYRAALAQDVWVAQ